MRSSLIHILKKRGIMLLFLLLVNLFGYSQTTTFNKLFTLYGNNPNTSFLSTAILQKGSDYILSGTGYDTLYNNTLPSINEYKQSLYFYKLDSTGIITKLISFSKKDINYYYNISSLTNTSEGGYCYVGDMDDTAHLYNNVIHFMIRFDSNMDTLWTKIIPHDTIWEAIRQIKETNDKGIIMVGERYIGFNQRHVLLLKTDSLGNELWRKIIPANLMSGGGSIIETPDKGFLINGYSGSYTLGQGDCLLIKTDSLGNQQWIKYMDINNNQHDGGGAMALTNDGNILYAYGNSYQTNPFNESYKARLKIIKYSLNGNLLWEKFYDKIRAELHVNKIQVFPNNDFILMGSNAERDSFSFFPSYLFKFDTNGDSLWRRTYFLVDHFADMNLLADNVLNADGSITACGWVQGDTLVPSQQIWIVKTDSNGYAPGPQNYVGIIDLPYLQIGYGGMKVYPNPATTQATISYPTTDKALILQLYNMLGQLIYEEKLSKGSSQTIIDTREYKKGLYKVVVGESSGSLLLNNE